MTGFFRQTMASFDYTACECVYRGALGSETRLISNDMMAVTHGCLLFITGRVKYNGADHGAEIYTSEFIHH